jgi:integral membrane protein
VKGTLTRFRVMAYIVGVMLLLLVGLAMPLKYIWKDHSVIEVVGPAHGFLYVLYLLAGLDLAVKSKWGTKTTLLVLISGAVPFLSFFVERSVTQRVRAEAAV